MSESLDLQPGDEVDVPWGLDTFPGRVLEVYQSGGALRVRVAVTIPGREDPETMVLRSEDLLAESRLSELSKPGSWTGSAQYERDVLDALLRTFSRHPESQGVKSVPRKPGPDGGFDSLIIGRNITLAVEIKWQLHELKHYTSRLAQIVGRLTEERGGRVVGLIISPNAPRAIVTVQHFGPALLAPNLLFVRWSGKHDDERLLEAIEMAYRIEA